MSTAVLHNNVDMFWEGNRTEDRHFQRIILWVIVAFVVPSILVPIISVTLPERIIVSAVPPRVAALMLERKKQPPENKTEAVIKKPLSEKKIVEKEIKKKPPLQSKAQRIAKARKKAKRSGLLALSKELDSLRDGALSKRLAKKKIVKEDVIKQVPVKVGKDQLEAAITSASSGIDNGLHEKVTATTELAEHEVMQMEGISEEELLQEELTKTIRSAEEIQEVMERNQGRLNTLYNRALRRNPALAGKVVLSLTITPDGDVSACTIVSSELEAPALERKLVARILLYQFESRDVSETTVSYPVEFFPQ